MCDGDGIISYDISYYIFDHIYWKDASRNQYPFRSVTSANNSAGRKFLFTACTYFQNYKNGSNRYFVGLVQIHIEKTANTFKDITIIAYHVHAEVFNLDVPQMGYIFDKGLNRVGFMAVETRNSIEEV